MKKFNLVMHAAVASAMLFSASAFAAVGTGQFATNNPALNYASEIVATTTAPVALTPSAANAAAGLTNVQIALGYVLSVNQTPFIRVALDNGARFSATPATPVTAANCSFGVVNTVGTNAIVFAATNANGVATTTCGSTAGTDFATVVMVPSIVGTASAVNVIYSMYDTAFNAQAGTANGLLATSTTPYLNFAPTVALTGTANTQVTADVTAAVPFTRFVTSAAGVTNVTSTTVAGLGAVRYAASTANTAPRRIDGTTIVLADLFGGTTSIAVTGDFSAVAGANAAANLTSVFLGTAACAALTPAVTATSLTASTATFVVGNAGNVGATASTLANVQLCYTINGTTAVPARVYSSALNAVSAVPAVYTAAGVTGVAAGEIIRNGTTLQAPFIQTSSGFLPRFVLTNTSSIAAAFTVAVITESGNVATPGAVTAGTIPANGVIILKGSDIIAGFTGSNLTRAAATFTIAAPAGAVQGVYQLYSATTGAVSNSAMPRTGVN